MKVFTQAEILAEAKNIEKILELDLKKDERWQFIVAILTELSEFEYARLLKAIQNTAIKMETVESTSLQAIGYDKEQKILRAGFKSSGIYDYFDVPEKIYKAILVAESKGKAFREMIVNAGFKFKRRK